MVGRFAVMLSSHRGHMPLTVMVRSRFPNSAAKDSTWDLGLSRQAADGAQSTVGEVAL